MSGTLPHAGPRDETGQALLEFAFTVAVFLVFFLAVVDFGRIVFGYLTLSQATSAAARVAIVDQGASRTCTGTPSTPGSWYCVGMSTASIISSDVTFDAPTYGSPCASSTPAVDCAVAITAHWQVTPFSPLLLALVQSINVTASARLPVERVYSTPTP